MSRPDLDLEMIGVPLGAQLTHVADEELTCTVVQLRPPLVVCQNKVMYLSPAASTPYRNVTDLRGCLFWKYKNETLQERRERFEAWHQHR